MTAHDDVARMAADPATDWDTLHWIAENHPELRPVVAGNPNTYPELLEALADLDDPAINAVLMRRFWPEDQWPEPEAEPEDDPEDHGPEPEPEAEGGDEAAASGLLLPGDDLPGSDLPEQEAAPGSEDGAAGLGAGAAHGGATAPEDGTEEDPEHSEGEDRRRGKVGLLILAVVLPLVAIGAIVALGMNLLGDRGTPAAEQAPTSEPTAAEPDETEEPSPEPEPEPEGPDLDELRVAVQEVPEDTDCEDPGTDAEPFELLAEAAVEQEEWDQDDEQLVQNTLEELRSACDSPYAAHVYLLLGGEEAPSEELGAAVQAMGIDWFDYAFPASGAAEMTTFSSPTGNVVCEIGDSLRCRVLEHSFEAPEGCEDGTTYRIQVDVGPEPDCEDQLSLDGEPQVLRYGQTAQNGFFACASFPAQMSCWNQLTGEGINLSSTRNSVY